jgi:predicted aconitase
MRLTDLEQSMLDGKQGEAVREALAFQLEVGRFFGAERFVPITNAHLMGDIEVMGNAGLGLLRRLSDHHGHCAVPTSTNARCMHFGEVDELRQDIVEIEKEKEIVRHIKDMGAVATDTCINYQTVYQPKLGEHVAWGDTGTVIYANSVLGARTNYEGGMSSFAASLTARTPAYGFHLDENRRGSLQVNVKAQLLDTADWGALGKIIGHPNQDYFSVPVFHGIDKMPLSDHLKHLGASLASYGSMAMYHMVGVTPEAMTSAQAFSGRHPDNVIEVTDADIAAVYSAYNYLEAQANIVVFSGPQLSIFEMQNLARLFEGRHVAYGMHVFVTTNLAVCSDAKRLGYLETLEKSGVKILQGVCFYILQRLSQIREENGWTNLISNSAKLVNTITAHRFNTILRKTDQCVEIACSGKLI